jgi:D-amino-acid dehydrogenase
VGRQMSEQWRSPDVAIVGGGSVGLMAALELTRRGLEPVVLERAGDVLSGCSGGSAGLLSPAHSTPLATPGAVREGLRHMLRRDSPFSMRPRPGLLLWLLRFMAAARPVRVLAGTEVLRRLSFGSLELHQALAATGLDTGLRALGAINVYETEAAFANGRAEARSLAAHEIKSQVLGPEEARSLEPALSDGVVGAVFYPDEAQCEPERFMLAVAEAAQSAGAVIRTRAEVFDVRMRAGRVTALETTLGEVRPREVVVANGAWVAQLSRRIGLHLPVEGGKGYHLDLEQAATDPAIPVYMQEARVIATPFENRLRLAGTLQLTGLDMRLDRTRVTATLNAGVRTLRGIDPRRVTEVWRGIRPCTPDGLPIIGRSARIENVVFATGHAMKGLHLAPATGSLVADLVVGQTPAHDLEPFSPDRFGGLGLADRRRNGPDGSRAHR